jgi:hypothetical protein
MGEVLSLNGNGTLVAIGGSDGFNFDDFATVLDVETGNALWHERNNQGERNRGRAVSGW